LLPVYSDVRTFVLSGLARATPDIPNPLLTLLNAPLARPRYTTVAHTFSTRRDAATHARSTTLRVLCTARCSAGTLPYACTHGEPPCGYLHFRAAYDIVSHVVIPVWLPTRAERSSLPLPASTSLATGLWDAVVAYYLFYRDVQVCRRTRRCDSTGYSTRGTNCVTHLHSLGHLRTSAVAHLLALSLSTRGVEHAWFA